MQRLVSVLMSMVLFLWPATASAVDEQALLAQAQRNCFYWQWKALSDDANSMIARLLSIEAEMGFPDAARGLLAAAACRESAYRKVSFGDCRTAGDSTMQTVARRCSSIGLFQWAGWAKAGIIRWQKKLGHDSAQYEDPRLDWEASAFFWGERFLKQIGKVKSECRYVPIDWRGRRTVDRFGTKMHRVVAAANAVAVRYPKCQKWVKTERGLWCASVSPRCWDGGCSRSIWDG